jgi:DNA-binding CsgD family transcriptional regulator
VTDVRPLGRTQETAHLDAFLAHSGPGPRILLLTGEAGSGKTTLLDEGRNTAVAGGHRVLPAAPVETETALAYAGLADLLETVPPDLVDGLPGPQRLAVRHAVLRLETSTDPVDPQTTAMGVRTLLRRLAADRPVLMVIDDLPWLDQPSARVLAFVLRRMRDEPVRLLAAARAGWTGNADGTSEPLPAALDGVPAEQVSRLSVGPLSGPALRELVRNRLGLSLSRVELTRLSALSGGNPLFALALAKQAQSGTPDGLFGLPEAPPSLAELIQAQIAALPDGARDVLLTAALSSQASLRELAAAAAQPATARADLEDGLRSRLVTLSGDAVRFAHPVVRSVVIASASAAGRRAAHRRLAAVVTSPEGHARHLALATDAPDEAVAQLVTEAARACAHDGARDDAADLAELALAITPLGSEEGRRARGLLAAEQRFAARDPDRARALLEDLLPALPAGPDRAEALRRLVRYRAFCGEPLAVQVATLAEALTQADSDPVLRTRIQLDQSVLQANMGDPAAGLTRVSQALWDAQEAGDEQLIAECSGGLVFVNFVTGRGVREDLVRRALAGPPAPPWLSMEQRPNIAVGHVLHWSGDLAGARACYREEYLRTVATGTQANLPLLLWGLAETEVWAGDWPRAERIVAEGYGLAEDADSPIELAFMTAVRAGLYACRGETEAARRDAARSMSLAEGLGMAVVGLVAAPAFGTAALSVGDAAAVHRDLAPFADAIRATGVIEPSLCRFLPDEIEALTRLGELDQAEALLTPFEARSAELDRAWGRAAAARCRGVLLAARRDTGGAAAALESALELTRSLGQPLEEARTLLVAGEVARRARRKQQAATLLREARQRFGDLGAPRWRNLAESELGRVGIRGPRPAPGSRPDGGPALTSAEQQVADLVLTGRTNTEIAAELFMGKRTVEAHLSQVYRKYQVRSRTELTRKLPRPAPSAE